MTRLRWTYGPRLGLGGRGEVYRARLRPGRREVAVKRLTAGLASGSAELQRLCREVCLVPELGHENVVEFLGVAHDDAGRLCLVMELVDGVDLAEVIGAGPLPLSVALHVAESLLRGLQHVHDLGLVHRDVAPRNVLVARDGTVKLGDFGLAKLAAARPTAGALLRGTVAYVSPEQARGRQLDGRSDLFAVGVIFYQMLTGRLPRTGVASEVIAQLVDESDIAPVDELRPGINPALSAVVMRLLAPKPGQRYSSANKALADLPVNPDGSDATAALVARSVPAKRSAVPARSRLLRRAAVVVLAAGIVVGAASIYPAMNVFRPDKPSGKAGSAEELDSRSDEGMMTPAPAEMQSNADIPPDPRIVVTKPPGVELDRGNVTARKASRRNHPKRKSGKTTKTKTAAERVSATAAGTTVYAPKWQFGETILPPESPPPDL